MINEHHYLTREFEAYLASFSRLNLRVQFILWMWQNDCENTSNIRNETKNEKIIMHEIQNKHIFEEIAAAASIFIFPV